MSSARGGAGRARRARGSRRRGGAAEEQGNDERWMASYMDMVTVLMCLFIVLYAMSTVDQEKFEQLKSSLANGFGIEVVEDDAESVPVTRVRPATIGDLAAHQSAAQQEFSDLTLLRDRIHADLIARGVAQSVRFEITERGLIVRLIGAETFFDGNSAALRAHAEIVLDTIAPRLLEVPNHVAIEGHAEPIGDSGPYPTDWELSADRATKVLRHFVEMNGMPQQRIEATGYGSARPATAGTTPDERAINRRVDIVVLSAESEVVRQLLPGLSQTSG